MRKYVIHMYACDKCHFENKSYDVVLAHEATHFNCTVQEYKYYLSLKEKAASCGYKLAIENNAQTRREFDTVCNEMVEFEIQHGIRK